MYSSRPWEDLTPRLPRASFRPTPPPTTPQVLASLRITEHQSSPFLLFDRSSMFVLCSTQHWVQQTLWQGQDKLGWQRLKWQLQRAQPCAWAWAMVFGDKDGPVWLPHWEQCADNGKAKACVGQGEWDTPTWLSIVSQGWKPLTCCFFHISTMAELNQQAPPQLNIKHCWLSHLSRILLMGDMLCWILGMKQQQDRHHTGPHPL